MTLGSVLEQRFADHLISLLEQMQAGCLVLPASGIADPLIHASNSGQLRRLVCLDARHEIAMAQGYAEASGKVAVVVAGSSCAAEISRLVDITRAGEIPLVVLLLDCPEPVLPSAYTYVAASGEDALSLMAYALARVGTGGALPVCIHMDASLLDKPLQFHPHRHDIERSVGFAAGDEYNIFSAEILQAINDAERTLLLVGWVGNGTVIRQKLVALASSLGANIVLDPLDPTSPLLAPSSVESIASLVNTADLVIGLNSARLAELLDFASKPVAAMVIHMADSLPEPSASASGHIVPVVDMYLRISPVTAITKLYELLAERDAEFAVRCPRKVEITRDTNRSGTFCDAGVQPIAGTGNFVPAAIGAAAAMVDDGRLPILRVTADDIMPDLAALWTLQNADIVATIYLDVARQIRAYPDIAASIRSLGIRVFAQSEDPGSTEYGVVQRGPVVRIGRTGDREVPSAVL